MARPRQYATAADKQAAYRQRWATRSIRLEKETDETIKRVATAYDVTPNEVIASMLKFALLNRNWMQVGLFGKPLTTLADIREAERVARLRGEA
jgi:hypothetical protein